MRLHSRWGQKLAKNHVRSMLEVAEEAVVEKADHCLAASELRVRNVR